MKPAPLPANEEARLKALQKLQILDSPREEMFDELTRLASELCETPVAIISLVDGGRQWFKSKVGMEVDETGREIAFCAHAIAQDELFIVEDATVDARFHDNPLVTGPNKIRFYAGAPIKTQGNLNLGSFCVIDHKPRQITPFQRNALKVLASQAARLMELRSAWRIHESHLLFQNAMLVHAASGIIATTPEGLITHFNPAAEKMLQYKASEVVNKCTPLIFHDKVEIDNRTAELTVEFGCPIEPGMSAFTRKASQAGQEETRVWTYIRKDGTRFPVLLSISPLTGINGELLGFMGIARDISEQRNIESALRKSQRLLSASIESANRQHELLAELRIAQDQFITNPSAKAAFDHILAILLRHTESEYGFIGEVLVDDHGQPFLKTHALTNIAWDDATRKFYDEFAPKGMEFHNLKTLFGQVMVTRMPVIANTPYTDPRRGGLPKGHPPLNAFLGVPIKMGNTMIGMVGVANRPGGYDEAMVSEIEPLMTTYANMIQARRNRIMREHTEEKLRENESRLQRVLDASGLGYWDADLVTNETNISGRWAEMLGYETGELVTRQIDWEKMIHPDDRERVMKTYGDHLDGKTPVYACEYRLKTKTGGWKWVSSEGRVTSRLPDGKPERVAGIHKDIDDQKKIEEQAKQIQQNKVLMQEVHHRVKNNLQIVSSLLSFQQRQAEDPKVAQSFEVSRNRVAAIALLHELLYRSPTIDRVSVRKMVSDLVNQIQKAQAVNPGRIKIIVDAEDFMINYDQAGPLALVVNEMVTNALKHAFSDGRHGEIRVHIERNEAEKRIHLQVSDNGVGMKKDHDHETTDSLGLKLVYRLSDQLQGVVNRLPRESGVCWQLTFPEQK